MGICARGRRRSLHLQWQTRALWAASRCRAARPQKEVREETGFGSTGLGAERRGKKKYVAGPGSEHRALRHHVIPRLCWTPCMFP